MRVTTSASQDSYCVKQQKQNNRHYTDDKDNTNQTKNKSETIHINYNTKNYLQLVFYHSWQEKYGQF